MRCEEIEKLIYLCKPGELSENEQELVKQHTASCADCRKLREELLNLNIPANVISSEYTEERQTSYYKEKIFEKVKSVEAIRNGSISSRFRRISLTFIAQPAYRYMSAAIISALVITFLLQNYLVYRHISALETRFGNPSSYTAAAENKAIVIGKEDLSFLKENKRKPLKTGLKSIELNWFRGNQFLLMAIRKHKLLQELANHNPGVDPSGIIKIYNRSLFSGESKRNQYKMEEKL